MARKARIALELQKKVKAEQSKLSNGILVTFQVDKENIRKMIGPNGSNIRAAQKIPGVVCAYLLILNHVLTNVMTQVSSASIFQLKGS